MTTATPKPTLSMPLITQPQELYAPAGCAICGGRSFPILDTQKDFGPTELRLYLCKTHAREIAKSWGWVKGPEQERLLDAANEIANFEKQRDEVLAFADRTVEQLTRTQNELALYKDACAAKDDEIAGLKMHLLKIGDAVNSANLGAPAQ